MSLSKPMKQLQSYFFILLAGVCSGLFGYVYTVPAIRFYLEAELPLVTNAGALQAFLYALSLSSVCLLVIWIGYSAFLARWLKKPLRHVLDRDAYTYLPLCFLAIVIVPGSSFPLKQLITLFQLGKNLLALMTVLGVIYLKVSEYQMLRRAQRNLQPQRLLPERPPTWIHIGVIFCLSLGIYFIVGIQLKAHLPLGGDEPHYLLITHSLVHDGDLDVHNNYVQKDYTSFFQGELRRHVTMGKDGTRYPGHPIGLSVMLIPFYGLFGRQGALIFINIMAAVLAVQLYLLAFSLTRSRRTALLLWGLCSFTAPLWLYSSQIYPEIPSACLFAIAFRLLFYPSTPDPGRNTVYPGHAQNVLIGLTLGILPWTQQRMILAATLLMLYYIATSGILTWVFRPKTMGIPWVRLLPVLLFTLSGLSLAAHYYVLYGSPLPGAPYHSIGMASVFSWEIFFKQGMLGLWLDQEAGLFMFAPHYVLIVPGFFLLLRRDWRKALGIGLLVLSIYVTCAGFVLRWYGSWSPASRYMVAVIPLLLPLLTESILCVRRLGFRMVFAFLGILSVGWSALFFITPDLSIMQGGGVNNLLEYYRTPIVDLPLIFPAFEALSIGMYVIAGIWIVIILSWSWWCVRSAQSKSRLDPIDISTSGPHHGYRNLRNLAGVYGVVIIVLLLMISITPSISAHGRFSKVAQNVHLHAFLEHFEHDIWRIDPANILNSSLQFEYGDKVKYGKVTQQGPRFLVSGPHEAFPSGKYTANFTLSLDSIPSSDAVAVIEVVKDLGRVRFGHKDIYGSDFPATDTPTVIELPFELFKQADNLETRLFFLNRVGIQIEKITIRPDFADFYYWAGLNALGREEYTKAETIFSYILSAGRMDAATLYQLGRLYQMKGQWEESRSLLQEAVRMLPNFADAQYRLGLALKHAGEPEAARAHFEHATRTLPEHLDAWQALHEMYQDLELHQLAQESEQVIEGLYSLEYAYESNLANQLMFLGYRAETAESGTFRMHYYWKALLPMRKDYVIFVHFKDGTTTFQQDHVTHKTETPDEPQVMYPTSEWQVGEVIHEVFDISAPSGKFTVKLGAWDPFETKQRLHLLTPSFFWGLPRTKILLQETIEIP